MSEKPKTLPREPTKDNLAAFATFASRLEALIRRRFPIAGQPKPRDSVSRISISEFLSTLGELDTARVFCPQSREGEFGLRSGWSYRTADEINHLWQVIDRLCQHYMPGFDRTRQGAEFTFTSDWPPPCDPDDLRLLGELATSLREKAAAAAPDQD